MNLKRLDPIVMSALEECGLPWEITPGGKHNKIFVEGKLVGTLPRGTHTGNTRAALNVRARIRRRSEELRHANRRG